MLVKRLDRHHRLWTIPFQEPGAPARLGITYAEAEQAAWAMDAHGARYRGASAILATLAVLFDWPWLWHVYDWPLAHTLLDRCYEWVARNRSHFPGVTPYCQQHPMRCGQPVEE